METSEPTEAPEAPRAADSPHANYGTPALWAGVLGAPLAWSLQLQVGYALVPWVCRHQVHWVLPALTVLFVLIAVACGLLSWRDFHRSGPAGRTRFLGALGLMTSSLFGLVILAQGIAWFFIDPCLH
jgi:hypothetical protein